MKLKEVTIHKYKSFEKEQNFKVQDDITILVGMNESGKTALLEALAKANYFKEDKDFKFDLTLDYPRKEKKKIDKALKKGESHPKAITLTFELDDNLTEKIEEELGKGVITQKEFSIYVDYNNETVWEVFDVNIQEFLKNKFSEYGIKDKELLNKILNCKSEKDLENILNEAHNNNEQNQETQDNINVIIDRLKNYFKNDRRWDNPIQEYITRVYLEPNLPKFLYYDEYYMLPSRISLEKLLNNTLDKEIDLEQVKTAKALIELADLDLEKILKEKNFEEMVAELEATGANISNELFRYWNTNKNLKIIFKIESNEEFDNQNNKRIVAHYLNVRVENTRAGVTLPLKNRSKGFNWFFSFLVWFNKIQEDADSEYILLLDEPGLNLHASAQEDLLKFIEDLSDNYQIIYTTHSPFMIPSDKLHRVRTIVETEEGSIISETIQEKDPRTLFPLQAALGYDIAQNLFISRNNLLVEGVSDMIYLEVLSGILEEAGKESLKQDITIVPTGGLDKVVTFISLLRGNKLDIVCLLDTPPSESKQKLDNVIKNKLIKEKNIRYFHDFVNFQPADIEDLFHPEDYLKLFNKAFDGKYEELTLSKLEQEEGPIIRKITRYLGIERFNHYLPAKTLSSNNFSSKDFYEETLNNFEQVFKEINKLL